MELEFLAPTIPALAAIGAVGLTYYFTKKKEIEANIRQKKTEMYDGLVQSLAEANTKQGDMNPMNKFIVSFYKASAYASDEVIQACYEFLTSLENKEMDEDKVTNLVSDIYNAVRTDINKNAQTFDFPTFSAEPVAEESQPAEVKEPLTLDQIDLRLKRVEKRLFNE
jgi:hypothetical protein